MKKGKIMDLGIWELVILVGMLAVAVGVVAGLIWLSRRWLIRR